MQNRETDYSYSIKYIFLYRTDHNQTIHSMIQPFTADDRLFELLTQTVIFVDIDSNLPFTETMRTEFAKIHSSPALIYVITGEVITDGGLIMTTLSDIYNDLIQTLENCWDNALMEAECNRDDHYISEIYSSGTGFDLNDQASIQQFANEYLNANKERIDYNYKNNNIGSIPQLKDKPIKETNIPKQSLNLNNLNLNI